MESFSRRARWLRSRICASMSESSKSEPPRLSPPPSFCREEGRPRVAPPLHVAALAACRAAGGPCGDGGRATAGVGGGAWGAVAFGVPPELATGEYSPLPAKSRSTIRVFCSRALPVFGRSPGAAFAEVAPTADARISSSSDNGGDTAFADVAPTAEARISSSFCFKASEAEPRMVRIWAVAWAAISSASRAASFARRPSASACSAATRARREYSSACKAASSARSVQASADGAATAGTERGSSAVGADTAVVTFGCASFARGTGANQVPTDGNSRKASGSAGTASCGGGTGASQVPTEGNLLKTGDGSASGGGGAGANHVPTEGNLLKTGG
mmetsp:Transcript_69758/g.141760  ORF Transcript_69758/g.141760 Transcript_69758/m.141760 type:complete len:332 (+) Transcript_69758:245-1240(+)